MDPADQLPRALVELALGEPLASRERVEVPRDEARLDVPAALLAEDGGDHERAGVKVIEIRGGGVSVAKRGSDPLFLGSVDESRTTGAQPCFDIAPEPPGKRQHFGNLRLRHRGRCVIRNAVALAPETVEFPSQRCIGPEGVFYGFHRNRVMAGRI